MINNFFVISQLESNICACVLLNSHLAQYENEIKCLTSPIENLSKHLQYPKIFCWHDFNDIIIM